MLETTANAHNEMHENSETNEAAEMKRGRDCANLIAEEKLEKFTKLGAMDFPTDELPRPKATQPLFKFNAFEKT